MKVRRTLRTKKRILIKVGTGVVTDDDGLVALGRISNLVEQISTLKKQGKEVILVTSGAVAMGKQKLDLRGPNARKLPRACAAAGQSGLMALYDTLFRLKNLTCAQVLVTDTDFMSKQRRENLRNTLNDLIALGSIPIINENDVISTREAPNIDEENAIFWDNDSLSALIAAELSADLLILLTDVQGLYRRPLAKTHLAEVIHTYTSNTTFTIGEASRVGRGGMQAKIDSCLNAISNGVGAVVIASGYRQNPILEVVNGEKVGTLFVKDPLGETDAEEYSTTQAETLANEARKVSQHLCRLSAQERNDLIKEIAASILNFEVEILEANKQDVEKAEEGGMPPKQIAQIALTPEKLRCIADVLKQITAHEDPLNKVLKRIEVTPGLELHQETVPIGVIFAILEMRPDVIPQLVALAIKSGNGLLVKGGKECPRSNETLYRIISEAINTSPKPVSSGLVGLIETREELDNLLKLDRSVDLVIPYGSADLVQSIIQHTKIPVLGHTEGLCHIYIDKAANVEKALRVIIDAKTDSPSAPNTVETLLLHKDLHEDERATLILKGLQDAGIKLFGGPRARSYYPDSSMLAPADSFKTQYGRKALTVEMVDNIHDAINHINTYGGGHTDVILTEDKATANLFIHEVNSACVFHNASTRFADVSHFGLGTEVGISTSKILARGPVGIEGLLSTKWILTSEEGHTASDFSTGKLRYTHSQLPLHARL
ncbi:Delta-1-pyrroline-5-carboxylate synthase [Balamuthia mandrillaris]